MRGAENKHELVRVDFYGEEDFFVTDYGLGRKWVGESTG